MEVRLSSGERGYFKGNVEGASAGDRYFYTLDREEYYPDPASRFQPEGVHGPSLIVDPAQFPWSDREWRGIDLGGFIIYELHTGVFTKEGTFDAVITRLDYLADLGITAIELMPIAQFPGMRDWGYDGTYPFAPQNTYGGPDGLKKLINSAHAKGLSVILDAVYNHLGPEGNYLHKFGPYFTAECRTPWGDAVNFGGPHSDEVRNYFICNALYWIHEYHIDALRIDAVHGIFDFSARHFLEELQEAVRLNSRDLNRNVFLIAESDLNDVRIIRPVEAGGYGIDAQWNDDFHHSLHTLLTGENSGYYEDFGSIGDLAKALREGFVYSGRYSEFRKRRHGNSSIGRPAVQFVVYSQSHDHVGNRAAGDRLSTTLPFEKLKLAAGVVLLSPYIPLLFMGEEYGETAPFQYFTNYGDDSVAAAVRKGRKEAFSSFGWRSDIPDPQNEETFLNSKLTEGLCEHGRHKVLFEFYRILIRMRKEIPALAIHDKESMEIKCSDEGKTLSVRRWAGADEVFIFYNFGNKAVVLKSLPFEGHWDKLLESSSERWREDGGPTETRMEERDPDFAATLRPYSFVVYRRI